MTSTFSTGSSEVWSCFMFASIFQVCLLFLFWTLSFFRSPVQQLLQTFKMPFTVNGREHVHLYNLVDNIYEGTEPVPVLRLLDIANIFLSVCGICTYTALWTFVLLESPFFLHSIHQPQTPQKAWFAKRHESKRKEVFLLYFGFSDSFIHSFIDWLWYLWVHIECWDLVYLWEMMPFCVFCFVFERWSVRSAFFKIALLWYGTPASTTTGVTWWYSGRPR